MMHHEDLQAPLGRSTVLLTILSLVLVLGGIAVAFWTTPPSFSWPIAVLLGGILLVAYLYHPARYRWSSDGLVIERPVGSLTIPRSTIRGTHLLKGADKFALRIFGVGGLLGHFGRYLSRKLGWVDFYVTNLEVPFLVIETTDGKRRVLSPSESGRERLLAELG